MLVRELKEELTALGLSTKGLKAVLEQRLSEARKPLSVIDINSPLSTRGTPNALIKQKFMPAALRSFRESRKEVEMETDDIAQDRCEMIKRMMSEQVPGLPCVELDMSFKQVMRRHASRDA